MVHGPLNAECSTANPVTNVASPLTGERETIFVPDDLFKKFLASGSSSLCGLAVNDDILRFIGQAIDFPRLKLAVLLRALGIECSSSSLIN